MPQPEQVSPTHETVMDVTVERLARVYAKAFMDAAGKSGSADGQVQELKSLVADVLNRFPKLEKVFQSSLVSAEQKQELLGRLFAQGASVQVLNFLKVLARHGRLELLRPIVKEAAKLHTERSGSADIKVRVAAKLDDSLFKDLQARLKQMLGKEPQLEVTVDPGLLAGIVVRVGDRVYDGSLYTQLERARQSMIDRATEQIESAPDKFLSAS